MLSGTGCIVDACNDIVASSKSSGHSEMWCTRVCSMMRMMKVVVTAVVTAGVAVE